MLRPDGMSSIEFKKKSFQKVHEWVSDHHATVIGTFENEPENMNAMVDQFPSAAHVFVEGAFVLNLPLKPSVIKIRDYR
jgi:hypothetical protein